MAGKVKYLRGGGTAKKGGGAKRIKNMSKNKKKGGY